MPSWIKLAASTIVVVLAACIFVSWRNAGKQQAALQAELKTAQQALADATARQTSRDAAVNALLAQFKQQKERIQSPAQAVAALPQVLSLPQPIALVPGKAGENPQAAVPGNAKAARKTLPDSPPPAAAQADLKDEQAKEQALSRERDDALRAAKGGSVVRRVARAAKWFLIGAAAGAVAAKAAHL